MFKVNNKNTRNDDNDIVLVFLLLTLNIFHTFFRVFLLLTLNKCLATNPAENDGRKSETYLIQEIRQFDKRTQI